MQKEKTFTSSQKCAMKMKETIKKNNAHIKMFFESVRKQFIRGIQKSVGVDSGQQYLIQSSYYLSSKLSLVNGYQGECGHKQCHKIAMAGT